MTAEELYRKEFGNADSIPKESVIRLLKHFAKALKIEREQALRIHDVVRRSEQLVCEYCNEDIKPTCCDSCLENMVNAVQKSN